MTWSTVLLADGSEGLLNQSEAYCSLALVNGNAWALRSTGEYVDVLDPRSGDLLDTLNLPEVSVLIRRVYDKVWFLTFNGGIILFEMSGILLGVLDTHIGKISNIHTFENCPYFLATSLKNAFQIWNLEKMIIQYEFSCLGTSIIEILPIDLNNLILSVQEECITLWSLNNSNPISVQPLEKATSAVLVKSNYKSKFFDNCWIGGSKWITIFRIINEPNQVSIYFQKERLIPCTKVRQLFLISQYRVASLDEEALVTIWDSQSFAPIRLFKIDTAMGIDRRSVFPIIFLAGVARERTFWTLCSKTCLSWVDKDFDDDTTMINIFHNPSNSVFNENNIHLQKKNICLLEMIDAYRKKIVEIISNTNGTNENTIKTIMTLDKCLDEQLEILRRDDDKSSSSIKRGNSPEQINYWRKKYFAERERNEILLKDFRLFSKGLNVNSNNLGFNANIADIFMTRCTFQERESQLLSRLLQLEGELYNFETNNNKDINIQKDNHNEYEQSQSKISELQKELYCAININEGAETTQKNIQKITETLNVTEKALYLERDKVLSLVKHISLIENENEKFINSIDYLQNELYKFKLENNKFIELFERQRLEAKEEAIRNSLKFSDKEDELCYFRKRVEEIDKSKNLLSEVKLKDAEIESLKKQLECVKNLLLLRQKENTTVNNIYDSILKMFYSLKRDSPMTVFVSLLKDIDSRLDRLNSSDKILIEKDDQIAVKDDELRILHNRIQVLEKNISQVSFLFSHIPYSVKDIEEMILELNEYHQRYGKSEDIKELVALHMLEAASTRHETKEIN